MRKIILSSKNCFEEKVFEDPKLRMLQQGTRFTQVRGPRRGKTLTPACLVFILSGVTMEIGDSSMLRR